MITYQAFKILAQVQNNDKIAITIGSYLKNKRVISHISDSFLTISAKTYQIRPE